MTGNSRYAGVGRSAGKDRDLVAKLRSFRARVQRLETETERLAREYPDQWAALHSGDVVVKSLDGLLKKLEAQGVPSSEEAIPGSFIQSPNMVLCEP